MSALFMISQTLDLGAFRHWAATRGHPADEGRALHHLLCETYGKSALQPFRLMVAPGARMATVYAYTHTDQAELLERARETGLPDALTVANPAHLTAKEMPAKWREGRRLAFDVRIRPVRRLMQPLAGWSRESRRPPR